MGLTDLRAWWRRPAAAIPAVTLHGSEPWAYFDEYHSMNFFSPSTLNVTARERGPRTAQLFASARARTAAPMAPPR
jgi:hypothetical protein